MSRRIALAVVRAPLPVPRLRLPSLRRPSLPAVVVALALAAAGAGAYALARETSLFAVESIDLRGAPGAVARDVRPVLEALEGESLVALDRDELERRLEAVPSVRRASVDRAFPHTLSIAVTPEQPLAVIRSGRKAWLVARTGRVVRPIEPDAHAKLPRIRAEIGALPRPGSALRGAPVAAALAVLRDATEAFRARVLYAAPADDGVTLVLREGPEVRLGVPLDVPEKLAAAAAVLRSLRIEGTTPAYVDVSVPARVVTGDESQPES